MRPAGGAGRARATGEESVPGTSDGRPTIGGGVPPHGGAATDRWVESLRPAKRPEGEALDPWAPLGVVEEAERLPGGGSERALTIFLAGRECPFRCVYCDLWRYTLDGPTPPGAIPRQVERALAGIDAAEAVAADAESNAADAGTVESLGGDAETARCEVAPSPPRRLKLYNASNWFDERAVPAADDWRVVELAAGFAGVTVESHPKMVGRRCEEFGERLAESAGARLEVAMGLETVHPEALPRLNKRMTVDDFDRAAERLGRLGIDLRAFVLVGTPFVPEAEQVEWAVRTVDHALAVGARQVALIPVRPGNGALEALAERGAWRRPRLAALEEAFAASLERERARGTGVVTVDAWDLSASGVDRDRECGACLGARIERLERTNRTGELEPQPECAACAANG